MDQNTFGLGGRAAGWRRTMVRAGIALAFAVLVSLSGRAAAQAADCMSFDSCYGTAQWDKALANQSFSAGVFYGKAADQAAARGDTAAAGLYRAASNQKLNQAQLFNIAFDQATDRAIFFGGGVTGSGEYGGDPGNVGSSCSGADFCTAGLHKVCKAKPVISKWRGKVGGHVVYEATVGTTWCWRGDTIVSHHTNYADHHLTDYGKNLGLKELQPYPEPHNGCHNSPRVVNINCMIRIQYGFEKTNWCPNPFNGFSCTRTYGGCIVTRIYGNRNGREGIWTPNSYSGNCRTTD